jgi:diaminopimelate epimerase
VRATRATTLETACGSGSLACALHLLGGTGRVIFLQPGGDTLTVDLHPSPDGGTLAWISGQVGCVAWGTAFVDCP